MSQKTKSGTIAFRPRARLLKLIGEELISDDVVAVSELVKNAHDADALKVIISFRGVTGPDGTIEVRDDGCGMNLDTLLHRWMEPAASTKVGEDRRVTVRGRRMLGEKGVGRFAADKLARHLELISRCKGSRDEIRAVVDWNQFDDGARMLEDIGNRWEQRTAQTISKQGTVLRLTGLRACWTERMFRRLSIRLGRLLSPFRDKDRFTVHIESDEFPEYSGEIRSDILEKAPYRIEAQFDGDQSITVSTGKMRPVERRWNGHGELSCGPVKIRLFAFDLEGDAVARIGPRMEVRAWLKEWTGISIYRDGFRIWPYGEPHDDWLRLDQRRVNNPVEHLSNNQVIGFIDINRDANPDLMDQTNREGLMHNGALDDLRRLVNFVLQILEAERQSVRHPLKKAAILKASHHGAKPAVMQELEKLASKADPEVGRELRDLGRRIAEEQASQVRLIEGFSGLAAIGQMTTGFLPVLPKEVDDMQAELQQLRRSLGLTNGLGKPLDRLQGSLSQMSDWLKLLTLASGAGERRRAIDVVAETEAFRDSMAPLLDMHSAWMELVYPERDVLRTEMRPEHFHCLMQILTSNAIDWMDENGNRRIRVTLSCDKENCDIVFSDTGPGIPVQLWTKVFEPQFSMKEDGRGMGLTIARRIVEAHGGGIYVILDGRRKGANFSIRLPRKRSRATFQSQQ